MVEHKYYVNRRGHGYTETVSECNSKKEAFAECREYRMSEPDAVYWVSPRPCKNWTEEAN